MEHALRTHNIALQTRPPLQNRPHSGNLRKKDAPLKRNWKHALPNRRQSNSTDKSKTKQTWQRRIAKRRTGKAQHTLQSDASDKNVRMFTQNANHGLRSL